MKMFAGVVAMLLAAPLFVSVQTTLAADTKAPVWKQDAGVHDTKEIIGTRIKNLDGKDLGEIDQLLIDRNGKVSHVVIGVGGLAGVGEKKVVVPWSELKMASATDGRKPAIMMDQAKLESAPRYERSARADRSPSASPSTSPLKDSDKDGKRDSADKAPLDPTKK